MSRWSQVIAELAKHPHSARVENSAVYTITQEHRSIAKDVSACEKELSSIEAARDHAQATLRAISEQAPPRKSVDGQSSDTNQTLDGYQTIDSSQKIDSYQKSIAANREDIDRLDKALLAVKATLSHNRFQLFQLQQQMDALQANQYLHQAQIERSKKGGVVTALHAYRKTQTQH